MPKVAPLDDMVRRLALKRANEVRQKFAENPKNNYRVMQQMEDDLIGELTPMLTKTWKPSMRRGLIGMKDIMETGEFNNQFVTGRSAGAYNPELRRAVSNEYFYDIGPAADRGKYSYLHVSNAEREKYGYLKPPKKVGYGDDVDWYGKYDIEFKPSVRKHMTVSNGDSFNNYQHSRYGHGMHGTPIVPAVPETYINWVAAPDDLEYGMATEDRFKEVLDDLKFYHRPTFRPGNEDYIEAQYHGPLTVDDIKSVTTIGNMQPWLKEAAGRHGFPVYDRYTGECLYNCR